MAQVTLGAGPVDPHTSNNVGVLISRPLCPSQNWFVAPLLRPRLRFRREEI